MPFLVEDGSGITSSNSYVELTFADDYFDLRGVESWAGKAEVKEEHLIMASDYADQRWGPRILGAPLVATQGLAIPRSAAYDKYGCPLEGVVPNWKKAVCEYALASLLGKLYPEASTVNAKEIKKKKTVVGPITTEVEYTDQASEVSTLNFPKADKLAKIMIGNSNQARTFR